MYKSIQPLTFERHGALRLAPSRGYDFAAQQALVPVVGAEIIKAAPAFPVVMVRVPGEEDATLRMMGVLSVIPNRSFFIAPDGRWLGSYIPAPLRSYPFVLLRSKEDSTQGVPCIDEGCPFLSKTDGQPLFTEDGQLSEVSRKAVQHLAATEQNRMATERGLSLLDDLGLLAPWAARVTVGSEEKALDSLLIVDEAKLNGLDDDAWLTLRRAGLFPLIYGHLLSLGRLDTLGGLSRLQGKLLSQQRAQPSLEEMLDLDEEDTFNFD
ncbi:SapC family protein [Roseospira visakhapatnamensis]|uniref:SapC protein n=1 Tax=Roseospira visakhapatnamensis TaxID=390880 RepID=A0A7W6WAL6_9PROT|nr:SapC family protein [Roseospira visakhapatnamensis]MBB4267094.1 hypothetical protein [Roseospira visakhapatnamensis]